MDQRRVGIVTGATGAIGGAIARQLAQHGLEVVLVARDTKRGEATAREIIDATGNEAVRVEHADLSSKADIDALASRFRGPLHVLVNNASATPRAREETSEGLEVQFATNILGYHRMIQGFAEQLADGARVINVASYWAGGMDLGDLQFRRRPYDNDTAYRQSKQAERMLTVAFAERLPHIFVNACHPGDVSSRLSRSLGFGGHETPDEAARTPVWLATGTQGGQVSGKYFEHQRQSACRFGADRAGVEALFAECQRIAG